jgi:hypothetical protein
MNHTEEDIEAANQHAMFHIHPDTSADSFLSGCEHKQKDAEEAIRIAVEYAVNEKQKEVDELVNLLRFYRNEGMITPNAIELNEEMIQKYKR